MRASVSCTRGWSRIAQLPPRERHEHVLEGRVMRSEHRELRAAARSSRCSLRITRPSRTCSCRSRGGSCAMRDHPLVQLTLARMREFYREPEAIFWVFGFPIVLAFALGIAFKNRGPGELKVGVVRAARSEERRV